jgi:hypothetical protein
MKIVAAGTNPVQLTRGIEKTVTALVKELQALSVDVADSDLANVATVSAGGNPVVMPLPPHPWVCRSSWVVGGVLSPPGSGCGSCWCVEGRADLLPMFSDCLGIGLVSQTPTCLMWPLSQREATLW